MGMEGRRGNCADKIRYLQKKQQQQKKRERGKKEDKIKKRILKSKKCTESLITNTEQLPTNIQNKTKKQKTEEEEDRRTEKLPHLCTQFNCCM